MCWSSTKWTSSAHWKLTFSSHDVAEKLLSLAFYNNHSLTQYKRLLPKMEFNFEDFNIHFVLRLTFLSFRPLMEPTSIRNVPLLAMSTFVEEFCLVLSWKWRCSEPLSLDEIIFTMLRSTIDLRRDIRICQFTAVLLLGMCILKLIVKLSKCVRAEWQQTLTYDEKFNSTDVSLHPDTHLKC